MKTFLATAVVLVVAVLVVLAQRPQDVPLLQVHGLAPPWSIDDLWIESDYVLIIEPTGVQREHWNNAENRMWEAPEDSGIMPMIVRDEEVVVRRTLKGDPPASMTIRNIGGVAGGFRFEYEGLYDLETGQQYLVFLSTERWPTQEGWESAIGFVLNGQGLFAPVDGGYRNSVDLRVAAADVARWDEVAP